MRSRRSKVNDRKRKRDNRSRITALNNQTLSQQAEVSAISQSAEVLVTEFQQPTASATPEQDEKHIGENKENIEEANFIDDLSSMLAEYGSDDGDERSVAILGFPEDYERSDDDSQS